MTTNLLRAFAVGPAGQAHPAARSVPTGYAHKVTGLER